ncbi:pseudouridine-5'-monophosphatase, partial [Elysia marginata]
TERCYSESIEEICQQYGKTFTWELKAKQMGQKEAVSAQIAIDELGLPLTVEEYLSSLRAKLEQKFPHAQLLPGAEKLIRHLHQHKVPIAVATGSDKWGFTKKTASHAELFTLFHHAVCASDDPDVKHGKPAPDCFLVCAGRFPDKPKPDQVHILTIGLKHLRLSHRVFVQDNLHSNSEM